MSIATIKLLEEFEALPLKERQEFAREFFLRLPPLDSGPLDDDLVAAAGDQIAAMLEQEENDAQAR
jgi:hypothetical protein